MRGPGVLGAAVETSYAAAIADSKTSSRVFWAALYSLDHRRLYHGGFSGAIMAGSKRLSAVPLCIYENKRAQRPYWPLI